jgi:hypothetical protein
MNHLTEEQFEDIMQGSTGAPAHLEQCEQCQKLLEEKRAIAARLHAAFESVQPGSNLADRIRSQLDQTQKSSPVPETSRHARERSVHWRFWSGLAAAAAILIVAVPLIYFTITKPVNASKAELVEIHNQNLGPGREFYIDADPEKLAEYFKNKLGFSPSIPRAGQGLEVRGCCLVHYQGEIAGSYVVDTPQGMISIIVVTDTPESIGLTQMPRQSPYDQAFWKGTFARCDMVAVRLGNYTYCAVGDASHELLTDLLGRLLP